MNTGEYETCDDQGVSDNLEHCQTPLNELLINRFRVQVPVGAPKKSLVKGNKLTRKAPRLPTHGDEMGTDTANSVKHHGLIGFKRGLRHQRTALLSI